MNVRFFLVFLLLGLPIVGFVPTGTSKRDDLTQQLTSIYEKSDFPGFAVTVVRKNKVDYQQAFGFANISQNIAYTNQTTQPIASVSKLFVGLALMKTVEMGLLSLDTEINTVLPFKVINPNQPNEPIRVRHLVTHTSGILDNESVSRRLYSILPGELLTTKEAKRMQHELKARTNGEMIPLNELMVAYLTVGGSLYSPANYGKAAPGNAYAYSNMATSLAAYLVEQAAGKSFPEFTKTEIFDPIGLKNTAWAVGRSAQPQAATLYWMKGKPLPHYVHSSYPDGMLTTSNEDLGIFLQAMMRGFSGESGILTKEGFRTLFARQFLEMPAQMNPKEDNYGVFWVWFKNGRVGHTGGGLGVATLLAFYPEKQTGIVFMTNLELEYSGNLKKLSEQFQQIVNALKAYEQFEN
ncbi:MAG: class A beta-lactamase-related serine hydrolase [Cytophagales bacterium]|nr:MAG: class A beta-lactamase-related serine hydrolase [Cytophagales bacterium]